MDKPPKLWISKLVIEIMSIIYSFVWKRQENMSDSVSVHWQQGKFQLCANCFMSWRQFRKWASESQRLLPPLTGVFNVLNTRPCQRRIGTSFNTRIHIGSVNSSVPWHSYRNITSPLVSIRPYRDRRPRRITAFVNLFCPYRLFSHVS